MEALALKVAGDVAVPVGTQIYETVKKQTGRAQFEQGKNSLQSGFALLRDEKVGGLLPAEERLQLLQAHSKLVANRENVDGITNTFYGSLAHRGTAKEFNSKAKKFRKDVETPAERAQMEHELRKAELELAINSKRDAGNSSDVKIPRQERNNSFPEEIRTSTKLKQVDGLKRSPTMLDYPISSHTRPEPPRPIQNQRTMSDPVQNTSAVQSLGAVNHNLRQRRSQHVLAPDKRSHPLINPTSLPQRQKGQGAYAAQTSGISQIHQHEAARRNQSQAAGPPFHNREHIQPASHTPNQNRHIAPEGVNVNGPAYYSSDKPRNHLNQSRSNVALADAFFDNTSPRALPKLSERESCDSMSTRPDNAPHINQSRHPPVEFGPTRNQNAVLCENFLTPAEQLSPPPPVGRNHNRPTIPSPPSYGDAASVPMHWTVNPPHQSTISNAHAGVCQCQNQNAAPASQALCASCGARMPEPAMPVFPHVHPSYFQIPEAYGGPFDTNNQAHCGNHFHHPRPAHVQVEVRVQYPPNTDYPRPGPYR
ncbi:hypothetical protein DFH06DRAFT_769229 [Mycena polygramma]|nr:hypothetical protein DFH06DRAFT_769229 [Mycena polygramma]